VADDPVRAGAHQAQPEGVPPERHAPADQRVVLLVVTLVVAVLVVNVLSALIPGMDGALAALPIVVLILVVGTVLVLARSLRR
jgi:hypothetical protein